MRITTRYASRHQQFAGRQGFSRHAEAYDAKVYINKQYSTELVVEFSHSKQGRFGGLSLPRDAAKRLAAALLSVSDSVIPEDTFSFDEHPPSRVPVDFLGRPKVGVTCREMQKVLATFIKDDPGHSEADAGGFLDEILRRSDLRICPR